MRAFLLRDLAPTAALGGQKWKTLTSTSTMPTSRKPQSTFTTSCIPRFLDPPHFSFHTPDIQPGLLLLFSPGASLTMRCCCTQPGRSTKLTLENIATCENLRSALLLEDSATSTALSAGDSLTSLARPFWCTGKRCPVHCQ